MAFNVIEESNWMFHHIEQDLQATDVPQATIRVTREFLSSIVSCPIATIQEKGRLLLNRWNERFSDMA